MSEDKFVEKVWGTKHVISTGRISCHPGMVTANGRMFIPHGGMYGWLHGEGRDFHLNREQAIAKAEQMRTAKIASLKKQIQKLEKMKFECPEAPVRQEQAA